MYKAGYHKNYKHNSVSTFIEYLSCGRHSFIYVYTHINVYVYMHIYTCIICYRFQILASPYEKVLVMSPFFSWGK